MNCVQWIPAGAWPEQRPDWCPVCDILIHSLDTGESTPNHYHDGHEYYIVCRGSASVILENQKFPVREGDVVAVFRGARHHIEDAADGFCYVALRDALLGEQRPGRLPDPQCRRFIGGQGRYEDGPVTEYDIPAGRCGVMNARTWFWLKQAPVWSWITSLGHIVFPDKGEEPDYHRHECDEIYLCVSGHLTALVDGQKYNMQAGDIVTIPAGTFHRVLVSQGESVLAYFYGSLKGLHRYGHLESPRDPWIL